MSMLRIVAIALCALAFASPAAAQNRAERTLGQLLAEHERVERQSDPVTSGQWGDDAALSRLPDFSPAADETRRAALAALRPRVAAVNERQLSADAALNRTLLLRTIDDALESMSFDLARLDADAGNFDGTARNMVLRSRADAEAWLSRLGQMAGAIEQTIANQRRGIATGWTQPRQIIEREIIVARATAERAAEDSPLLLPFETLPSNVSQAERDALRARGLAIVREQIKPAQQAQLRFLDSELLPAARPRLGARTLPNGDAYYSYLVRSFTTTNMTPEEVHALGQSEVRRIRALMDGAIAESGFRGSFAQFIQFLRTDPQFYARTPEELERYVAFLTRRADAGLPRLFGRLPQLTYDVRRTPDEIASTAPTAGYDLGSMNLGQPGVYYLNTYALNQRPLYEMPALTLHEATPGHHTQLALMQEQPEAPYFRRTDWFTSFVEGWGLYAEFLGTDLDFYTTPYERFGQLSYEMWRACRLVADTGIHWLGWTYEEARRCFEENTALADQNITAEVNRYIARPGQALAYKIGELTFRRLRGEAETALGDRFDIRAFHDHLLGAGALPMDVVETRMRAWIAAQQN
jgi:uncharacterized protein (DUF885 family)